MAKKVKEKKLFQWCIKSTYVNEVLTLSDEVGIDEIAFEIGFSLKRIVSEIPPTLRELGVTYLREPASSMEAQGTLHGSRSQMLKSAKEICKYLQFDFRHMRVRRMKVSCDGTTAIFTRMGKKMAGQEGKTESIKVLGLAVSEGTDEGVNKMIAKLNAKKIACKYSVQPVWTVICSES